MLQTRVREREERFEREEQLHQFRRDSLIARGVPREYVDLLPRNSSDRLPTQLMDDLDALRQKEEEKEARKQKAKEAFEGRWLKETGRSYTNASTLKIPISSQTLKHMYSLTSSSSEAIEERRRVCVDLRILRQQDQHLVKFVQEPLPTTCELDEVTQTEVATESRQTTPFPEAESSDDQSMFVTPLPASHKRRLCTYSRWLCNT